MSFLVVHDISEQTPYAIIKVPEDATTRDVIKQAVAKAGVAGKSEHDYVLLEEVQVPFLSPSSLPFRSFGHSQAQIDASPHRADDPSPLPATL